MRDNFSAKTIRVLANRVAYCCSNPDCQRLTIGPALDEGRSLNVGVAAHITAASPNGPRFDPTSSADRRSDGSNGIWLCQTCAKLIDTDVERYPVAKIREWKKQAVERAFIAVARAPGAVPHDACADTTLQTTRERVRGAVIGYLDAFRNAREWPANTIDLTFTTAIGSSETAISLDGLAAGAGVTDHVNIVSAPGTGKSTTLVQLAARMARGSGPLPILVPLNEWSDHPSDFFDFLLRRHAFRSLQREHFTQLASEGVMVLLLDGWNELSSGAREKALRDLRVLRRDFPLLGAVITTRKILPVDGIVVTIAPLTEDQQVSLAKQVRPDAGEALVDQAWRTPGVRELIAIPLYLQALLTSTRGDAFPTTKDEILSLFVKQHERSAEHADTFREIFHTRMLEGLATAGRRDVTPTLSEEVARRVVSEIGASLVASGQLSSTPDPNRVLSTLISHHLLVRAAQGSEISFQHQQFQEWFASFEIERLISQAAASGAASAALPVELMPLVSKATASRMLETPEASGGQASENLRRDFLNWPAWEESILFACERLSRRDASGATAVGALIVQTLAIDPIFAAAMIFRSSPDSWAAAQEKVLAFIERWHTPGEPDRASRFMITSGRPEFARYLWPLITNPDSQVHLRTLRKAERFRPSVLGPDTSSKLKALPVDLRQAVLSEITMRSGYDGMQLAASFAVGETDPAVVVEIVEALDFRRADRLVNDVLRTASDEVWRRIAASNYPERLTDAVLNARLEIERGRYLQDEAAFGPIQLLHRLAHSRRPSDDDIAAGGRIETLIASPAFPIDDQHVASALHEAGRHFGDSVANALLSRLANNLALPFRAVDFLVNVPPIDEGIIPGLALDPSTDKEVAAVVAKVIGPQTIGVLIDHFVAAMNTVSAGTSSVPASVRAETNRLSDTIRLSRNDAFFTVLLERAESERPEHVPILCDLIAYHGSDLNGEELQIGAGRPRVVDLLARWGHQLLKRTNISRHQRAVLARAMGRIPDPGYAPLLDEMLRRDLAEWAQAREEYSRLRRGGVLTADETHSYTLLYRNAFAALATPEVAEQMTHWLPDPRFGIEAAWVLVDIWRRKNEPEEAKRFRVGRDYSGVKARRAQLAKPERPPKTSDASEAIFKAVQAVGRPDADPKLRVHALQLAAVGLRIPYGGKQREIAALLALPEPWKLKLGLLTSMAFAGEVLSANDLRAGVNELFEAGKTEPWRLADNHGELDSWLELFAFSDRPAAVLEILDRSPGGQHSSSNLRSLLSALGESPDEDEAVDLLQILAQRFPQLKQAYEWSNALTRIGTVKANLVLLDAVTGDQSDGQVRINERWRMAEVFAEAAQAFPSFREAVMERHENVGAGRVDEFTESILAKIGDEDCLLKLIDRYASTQRTFDHMLSGAVFKLAVGRRPVADWPGAFEEFSVPLVNLRKALFGMYTSGTPGAALAGAALAKIDQLRDRHGRIDDEPRHPDLASGIPWPAEAGE